MLHVRAERTLVIPTSNGQPQSQIVITNKTFRILITVWRFWSDNMISTSWHACRSMFMSAKDSTQHTDNIAKLTENVSISIGHMTFVLPSCAHCEQKTINSCSLFIRAIACVCNALYCMFSQEKISFQFEIISNSCIQRKLNNTNEAHRILFDPFTVLLTLCCSYSYILSGSDLLFCKINGNQCTGDVYFISLTHVACRVQSSPRGPVSVRKLWRLCKWK